MNEQRLQRLRELLQGVDEFPDGILGTFQTNAGTVMSQIKTEVGAERVAEVARAVSALHGDLPAGVTGLRGIDAVQFYLSANTETRRLLARYQLARQTAEIQFRRLMRWYIIGRCLCSFYETQSAAAHAGITLRDLQKVLSQAEDQLGCAVTELYDNLPDFPTHRIVFGDAVGLSLVRK
jgi:hypothetical protein